MIIYWYVGMNDDMLAWMWRNWDPHTLCEHVKRCSYFGLELCESVKQNDHINDQFYPYVYNQGEWKHMSVQKFAHKCSQKHYSQGPKNGNHPNFHHLIYEQIKCGISYNGILLGNKRNEMLIRATTWTIIENMLSTRSQVQAFVTVRKSDGLKTVLASAFLPATNSCTIYFR